MPPARKMTMTDVLSCRLRAILLYGACAFSLLPLSVAWGQSDAAQGARAEESEGAAQERFDYHSVRGRSAKAAGVRRYEGEVDFELMGKSRSQGLRAYGEDWSGDAHLLWDGRVGEKMQTSFEVDGDGEYDVLLQLTAAPDYGVFDIYLGDRLLRKGVDLYGPRVALAHLLTFRSVRLKRGVNRLTFALTGSHPKAVKFQNVGYLMGLDYLQLVNKRATESPRPALRADAKPEDRKTAVRANPLPFDELTSVMRRYCSNCHQGSEAEGGFNLDSLESTATLSANMELTRKLRRAVSRRVMPPDGEPQPSDALRLRWSATMDEIVDRYLRDNRSTATVVMRRMNRFEFNNAVRDLLELRGDIYPLPEKTIRADQPYFRPQTGRFPNAIRVGNRTLGKNQVERQILTGVSPFAIDLQAEGGFNNRGRELSVSPIFIESILQLSRAIVYSPEFDEYCGIFESFFSFPADADSSQPQIARQRLQVLLERAFRSRVETATIERYANFFERRFRETGSFQHSMKDVVAAVLASPRFLYLAEPRGGGEDEMLDSFQLATRLSFFLWSSIPDEPLLAAARDGTLSNPAVLDSHVRRMLEDPKCQALSQNFARQWLRLDQLVTAVPDYDRFPHYYSRIGCEQWKFGLQMMIEPLLLFESIMVEDRSILLLVDSNYSYRSDELQSWYEVETPFAGRENRNRFNTNQQVYRRRSLTNRRQGGVVTNAATLTMTSSSLRTSPITRGAWVSTVIFNEPPPPPPDSVPPIEADDKEIEAQGMTVRQRLQQHRSSPACASCHRKIDPLGFALENFDAVGRWREKYTSGLEIDASGRLFGTRKFRDVVGLKDSLLDHPELFVRSFAEHMLSYALARELELSDAPALDEIAHRVVLDRGRFTTLVREIVLSHPFRYRGGEASIDAGETSK